MLNRLIYLLIASLLSCSVWATQHTDNSCNHSYKLDIHTSTHFDFGSGSITRQKFNALLSVMKLHADDEQPDAIWWGIQLSDIAMTTNGTVTAAPAELSTPFALLKHNNGNLVDFRFAPQHSKAIQQQLKGLAYYLQFPASNYWPAENEQRQQMDTIGSYQAQYTHTESTSENQALPYRKTKLRYLSGDNMDISGDNPVQTIEIKSATQDIALNHCWFNQVKGKESLIFKGAADSFSMNMEQTYNIKPQDELADIALWSMPGNVNGWQFPELAQVNLSDEQRLALEKRFVQALKQTDLLAMRGSKLAEWLLQFDEVISVLRDELLTASFNDEQKMRLFNALGHLDSENGNQLLVTLINDTEFSETDRFRAIRAITTGTSALSPTLKAQLSGMLNNDEFIGSEALYGATLMTLGAVLQRREHNAMSDELFTEITNRLVNSEDEQHQSALVASLGNSQMPEAVDTLKDYAQSNSARVRANVATSLGQIADDSSQQALKTMLQQEPDDKVQQAVLGAIAQFELEDQDLIKISEIAQQSNSERTRGNAIKALANQTHKSQQVQQQLRQLMQSETSRRNFALAAKSIEALKQQSDSN